MTLKPPPVDTDEDRETPDDETRVYGAEPGAADAQIPGVKVRARSDRPTLFGGLLGPVIPGRITPTKLSPTPGAPAGDRIAERFADLCDASQARGEPAVHCDGVMCADLCECRCVPCQRATTFLLQAQDENPGT